MRQPLFVHETARRPTGGDAVGAEPPAGGGGRRSCPSGWRTRSCRRSRDRSGRPRGARCRRSSRRTGSRRPGGRCRSSCRSRSRRARARRRRWRASPAGSPRRARRAPSTTRPSRNSSSIPATSTPRGLDGIVKRMRPSAESSSGPVKTSPEGMLRLPSELTQVRPATDSVRSVPSASMRSSRAPASRSISRAWQRAQLAPGGDRVVAVEEQRALDERREIAPSHIPACWAPAARRPQRPAPAARQRSSRTGARARAARAIRAGSTPASARVLAGAWIAQQRVGARASASSAGGKPSRWTSRAAARTPRLRRAAPRAAAATPRARAAPPGARAAAAPRAWSSARAPAGPAAPRGSSRTAARRSARGQALSRAPPPRGTSRRTRPRS